MREAEIFEYEELGKVRVYEHNGKFYLPVADIYQRASDFFNSPEAVSNFCKPGSWKVSSVYEFDGFHFNVVADIPMDKLMAIKDALDRMIRRERNYLRVEGLDE